VSDSEKFDLPIDGIHGSQVLVYDADDLAHWSGKATRAGMKMILTCHVDCGVFATFDQAHDIYQIVPVRSV